jgi:hypothetical protein
MTGDWPEFPNDGSSHRSETHGKRASHFYYSSGKSATSNGQQYRLYKSDTSIKLSLYATFEVCNLKALGSVAISLQAIAHGPRGGYGAK